MMNRHGLVAGATGTGKTKTLQGIAEQLSAAGRAGRSSPTSRATCRAWPRPATPAGRPPKRSAGARPAVRADRLPGRVPLARRHRPRRAGARDGVGLRARSCWRRSSGANETQEQSLAARLPLRRRQGPAAARPRRPARAADLPGLRRGQGRARGHRRALDGDRRRAAARARRRSRPAAGPSSSASRSSTSPTCCAPRPTAAGVISCLELPAVQDKPTLFSTALMWLLAELFEALPEAGDLRQAQARRSSSTRRTCCSTAPPRRSSQSVEQTVRLIRSKGVGVFFVTQTPEGRARRRPRPARQPRPARAARVHARRREGAEGDRLDVPEVRVLRPRGAAAVSSGIGEAAVTILDEDGVPDAGRPHAAARRRGRAWGPADDVDGRREGVAAVRASTARASTGESRARCSPRGWTKAAPADAPATTPVPDARAPAAPKGPSPRRAPAAESPAGPGRRLPGLPPGQAAAEAGHARRLRHAAEEAVTASVPARAARSPPSTRSCAASIRALRRPRAAPARRASGSTRAGSRTTSSRAWASSGCSG